MGETVLGRAVREVKENEAYIERKRRRYRPTKLPATKLQDQKQILSAVTEAGSRQQESGSSATRSTKRVRPPRRSVTFRCEADVLAWLKADGRGYQSRIKAILRSAMLDAKQKSCRSVPGT